MKTSAFPCLALLALLSTVRAQSAAPPSPRNNDGPWNHRVLLATSKDGLAWTVGNEILAEHASVPELFLDPDGKPILLFVDASGESRPGALGALVRGDDGKWTRAETNLRGADPNVVRLKVGTYRGHTKDRDGAIIVSTSRDGLDWERVGAAFQDSRYRNSTDSDVFETPDGWVMLISLGPRMLRCTSSDGVKFTTDGTILELGGSVSDTVAVKGGWRTFFHVNATPQTGGKMLIRSAFTAGGKTWKVEPGDRVVAPFSGPASLGVADPAPAQLKDGSWLMAVKSFIEAPQARQFGAQVSNLRVSRIGHRAGWTPALQPPPGGSSTPREHEVHSATSKDGLTWTRDEGIRLTSASVPCVINDGDKRILLYVVRPPDEPGGIGGVFCAISTDGTNFTINRDFRIEGLSTRTAADPSIIKDEAGKFRLYYLASNHRGDPAAGENPHKISYALSDDGIRFREVGTAFTYDDLVDPDVFRFKGQWFMYVHARGTIIATSSDGKKFSYVKPMSPPGWGTVAPLALADGRLRLYAFDQRTPIGNTVKSFISTDGLNWTTEAGDRLKANADEQITDPFVIPWRGGYKMYFKHSPARTRGLTGGAPQNRAGQFGERDLPPHPDPLPQGEGTAGGRADLAQRPDGQASGPNVLPLPRGEGRGEGERSAQILQPPNNFNPQPPPQNFANADGPWNRDVIAWRVSASGAVEKAATFERAGVPTIARMKDGRLIVAHQHFPENDRENFDKVAVHFSSDDGKTWGAAQVIQVTGLPEGMRFPFDPTLVPLPDGRVRLYFTGNMGRTFQRSTPAIHSAISKDGVNYTYEPGARFAVEGRAVIDCAVALHNGVFHLFAPDNGAGENPGQRRQNESAADRAREGAGYHATSKDGLNFTRVDDVQIEGRRSWLGNAQSDGKLITFYGTGQGLSTGGTGRQPRGGLWMATSADGKTWKLIANPPITGGDPGAVTTRDGGLMVVITSEPVRRVRPMQVPGGAGYRPALRGNLPRGTEGRQSARGDQFTPSPPGESPGRTGASPVPSNSRPRGDDFALPALAQTERGDQRYARTSHPDGTLDLASLWSNGRAVGKGPVRFTHSPMRVEDIERILPYGLMVGGHVCPIDHGYFFPRQLKPGQPHFDVLAPADGFVVMIGHRTQLTGSTERGRDYDDYALTIEHSGTFYTQYDLLTSLDKAVLDQLEGSVRERFARKQMGPPVQTRIAVKGGQVIGKVGGRSLDFGVVNTEVKLPGFLTPKLYGHYAWRIHVVDPFDFFDEPLKSQLLALNVRKVKPFFGRIDYDVDGRLIGNWFREGSGGYPGDRRDPRGYWMGHLAFAPHHIDSTKFVVSLGDFGGRPAQYCVKGNAPDPAKVGEADGVVKYELIWSQLGNDGTRQLRHDADSVQGTVLAQVLPGRKLKFEAFPGKTGAEVKDFTSAARTYER